MALGRALKSLLSENLLVIGSGFSFHNMQAFQFGGDSGRDQKNDAFQEWLIECCTADHSQEEREEMLIHWESAPGSRYCHPREEHLIPLHICAAMADDKARLIFDGTILGKRSIALRW